MRNKSKFNCFLWIIGALLAWAGASPAPCAYATASTIIWGPSTDTEPFKKLHLTGDVYAPVENDASDARPATIIDIGLTAGVLPFEKFNAELGFDYKSGTDIDDKPLYFNGKLAVPENAYGDFFPALAAGIYDVGTDPDKTDFNVVYGRVAKTINIGKACLGRFSAGGFVGNKDRLTYHEKKSSHGLLFGWERQLTEISDKWWIGVDYQGSKSAYGAMNVGVSYKFADNTSVIFGYDFFNNHDLADTFTVQLDIDF